MESQWKEHYAIQANAARPITTKKRILQSALPRYRASVTIAFVITVIAYKMLQRHRRSLNGILILHLCAFTYLVSIMKCVTGALRGCCEWAHDKFTEREVKLISSGRSGGSGTSALSQIGKSQKINTKIQRKKRKERRESKLKMK